jgi:hypothetical protein
VHPWQFDLAHSYRYPACVFLCFWLCGDAAHTNNSGNNDNETIVPESGAQGQLLRAFIAWHHLWRGLSDQSLPFVLLQALAPTLLAPLNNNSKVASNSSNKTYADGLDALSGSAPSARRHLLESLRTRDGALPRFVWPSGLPDSSWCHHQRRTLKRFELLATLRRSRIKVARSLVALQKLIKPEAQPQVMSKFSSVLKDVNAQPFSNLLELHPQVEGLRHSLEILGSQLDLEWHKYTLQDLEQLATKASDIHVFSLLYT